MLLATSPLIWIAALTHVTGRAVIAAPSNTTLIPGGWAYKGCAEDYADPAWVRYRVLGDSLAEVFPDPLVPSSCMTACGTQSFPFAGVENGTQCFCGRSLQGLHGTRESVAWKPDEACSEPCAGDKSQLCGASRRLQLYEAVSLKVSASATSYASSSATTTLPPRNSSSASSSILSQIEDIPTSSTLQQSQALGDFPAHERTLTTAITSSPAVAPGSSSFAEPTSSGISPPRTGSHDSSPCPPKESGPVTVCSDLPASRAVHCCLPVPTCYVVSILLIYGAIL